MDLDKLFASSSKEEDIGALTREILDGILNGVWVSDKDANIIYCNAAMSKIAGIPSQKLIGKNFLNDFGERTTKYFRSYYDKAKLSMESLYYDAIPVVTPAGRHTYQSGWLIPRSKNGSFDGMICSVEDSTERIRYRMKLESINEELQKIVEEKTKKHQESEEKYKELFKFISSGVAVYHAYNDGEDFIFKDLNLAGEKSDKIKKENILGKRVTQAFPGIIDMGLLDVFRRVWKTGTPEKFPVSFYKDNRISGWRENYVYRLSSGEIVAVYDDITKEKQLEQTLIDSEEKFRTIADKLSVGISIIQKGRYVYINDAYSEIYGYKKEEIMNWTLPSFFQDIVFSDDKFELLNKIKAQMDNNEDLLSYTTRVKTKGNAIKWLKVLGVSIKYQGDRAILDSIIDITDRKKIEETLKLEKIKLRDSEEKFRVIAEQSMLGISIMQRDSVKFVNKTFANIFGYTKEEVLDWKIEDMNKRIHPDDFALVLAQLQKKQHGEQDIIKHYQYRGIKKNGDVIWLDNYSRSIKYNQELANLVTINDITERIEMIEMLKDSEDKFRVIAEQSIMGIFISQNSKVLFLNKACADIYGYTVEEMFEWGEKEAFDHIYPDDKQFVYEQFQKKQRGEQEDIVVHHQYRIIRKNGDVKWVDNYSRSIQIKGESADMVTIIDITDQKLAEKKLERERIKANNYLDIAAVPILALDRQGKIILLNKKGHELLEYAPNELLGKKWFETCVPKKHRAKSYEIFNEILNGKIDDWLYVESELITKTGEKRTFAWHNSLVYDRENNITATLSSALDVTERNEMIKILQDSEEKFSQLFNQATDAIILQKLDPSIDNAVTIDANPAALKLFGYNKIEMIGRTSDSFNDPNDVQKYEDARRTLLEKKRISVELNLMNKSGKSFPVEINSILFKLQNNSVILSIARDITHRKKIEQELTKVSMMKSELLRRTSHELKTPLVAIKGFTDLVMEKYDNIDPETLLRYMGNIKNSSIRLEVLIKDILSAARLESGERAVNKEFIDLSEIIKKALSDLSVLIERRHHVVRTDLIEPLLIYVEIEGINKIVSNLILNSIKYTPSNGVIFIQTKKIDDEVVFSIQDNGIGFTESEKEELFTQFGKIEHYGEGFDIISEGSGLGLYISKKIIDLHGGKIWVESRGRNKGATFCFSLPL